MASNWIHCPECGHRLFFNKGGEFLIEIKCPSCKQIMTIDQNTKGGDRNAAMRIRKLSVQDNRMLEKV